jgi:hypothetical protein
MTTPNEDKDKQPEQVGLSQVSLKWQPAEDLQTIYANQIMVSHSGPEFYLVFGEVITPAVSGHPFGPIPTELPVKAVVKIAITPPAMLEMANLINSNIDRFLKTRMMLEQETEKKDE